MPDQTAPITELLRLVSKGDAVAENRLLDLLYSELRKIAAVCMNRERGDHTLQPSALVNEAYLRLVSKKEKSWQNRNHFLAVVAQVMRHVLVDYARAKSSKKRAGEAIRIELDKALLPSRAGWQEKVIDVDSALAKLTEFDARMARIVEFRYFAGMTESEIAAVLGLSERTIKRECKAARAWLYGELRGIEPVKPSPASKGAARGASSGEP